MTELLPLILKVVGAALDIFSRAGGAEKLKSWLTGALEDLQGIRAELEPPPPPKT